MMLSIFQFSVNEIDIPEKPLSTNAKQSLTMVFEGCQFQLLLYQTDTIKIMGKKLDTFVSKDKTYITCNLTFFFKFSLYD